MPPICPRKSKNKNRHSNNRGITRIKNDKNEKDLKIIAKKMGVKYG